MLALSSFTIGLLVGGAAVAVLVVLLAFVIVLSVAKGMRNIF